MKKSYLIFTVLLIVFIACNDFLDQNPDQRIEWTTPDQIKELLVNAYSDANYALIGELSSDNVIDNQSPDEKGNNWLVGAYNRLQDEMFAWQEASESGSDSPFSVWESYYHAIAVCNHALQLIDEMKTSNKDTTLNAQIGEALISRAYHHFILVNIFSHTYKGENQTDLGIPYVIEPETVVEVNYNRGTVPEVYRKIELDIIEGLKLLRDDYEQPKYHFTVQAAHAFAARFYLFKREWRKVIEHADIVLGNSPVLRNWKGSMNLPTFDANMFWFIDATSTNNLLLIPSYSIASRIYGWRYGCNREAQQGTLRSNGPSGSMAGCYSGKLYVRGRQEYGIFFGPLGGEIFEYTDKIARIGYAHQVRAEFTTDETLLCRAEAKAHLGLLDEAFDDFYLYESSRYVGSTTLNLTPKRITDYFTNDRANKPVQYKDLNTESINPSWKVDSVILPYVQCALYYRRHENIHNGMRWFDIKRYGIEYWHKIQKDSTFLSVNDPRRAIQIPADVIAAGLEANKRDTMTQQKSSPIGNPILFQN